MGISIYAGPAKVYRDGVAYFPEGENGSVNFTIEQEKLPVASALVGQARFQQGDVTGKITVTPFDNWGLLAKLFPPALGASVGVTAGVLAIGTKLASGAALVPTKIWVPGDARLYTAVNTAIVKPPDLRLGVGKALYGPMEIACIGDASKPLGSAGFLYSIDESAAADPGGVMTMTDCIREKWTAAWGSEYADMEAEEEWVVKCEIKVQAYKVQKLTCLIKLISASYMVSGRVVGPAHTVLDTMVGINVSREPGSSFEGEDLVLTSSSGKVITLKNAAPVGIGFEFGGSRLGTGEIGWVNAMTITAGVVQPLITFSA